jgi:heat shock protein 4
VDPILTSAEIEKKRDEVIYFATPILMKPKPAVPSGTQTPKSRTDAPDPAAAGTPPHPSQMVMGLQVERRPVLLRWM